MPSINHRPASVLHLAARLRALLGLSTSDLALVIGVDARTLTRMETWSGSVLTSIRALAETSQERAPDLIVELSSLHACRNPDPPDPALLASLGSKARQSLAELDSRPGSAVLLELCTKPLPWLYWATSARAADTTTRDLADNDGLIVRPLLQGETDPRELHPYLLALRPGDEVLLCHDSTPVGWYELQSSNDSALIHLARLRLGSRTGGTRGKALTSRAGTDPGKGARPIELVDALPAVFRHVELASPLGQRLAATSYRLFDNSPPSPRSAAPWFSVLSVRRLPGRAVPSPTEFARRPVGERARMTRFRRSPAV